MSEIEEKNWDEVPVNVSGSNIPNSGLGMGLTPVLKEIIRRNRKIRPTALQRHAIPMILGGRDLMACGPSGSGKTLAFCIPIINGVMKHTRSKSYRSIAFPVALILCPTEQIAYRNYSEVSKMCHQIGVRVAYANTLSYNKLIGKTDDVDILVATPEQILDIINVPELVEKPRLSLINIKYLALDEADQMLPKLHLEIRRIINHTDMPSAGARQTSFFGTTFSSEIQMFASDFLSDYIFLCVGEVGSSIFACHDCRSEYDNSRPSSDYYYYSDLHSDGAAPATTSPEVSESYGRADVGHGYESIVASGWE